MVWAIPADTPHLTQSTLTPSPKYIPGRDSAEPPGSALARRYLGWHSLPAQNSWTGSGRVMASQYVSSTSIPS